MKYTFVTPTSSTPFIIPYKPKSGCKHHCLRWHTVKILELILPILKNQSLISLEQTPKKEW